MTAYICGATSQLVEGHHPENCVPCLQRMRDYWKSIANANLEEQNRKQASRIAQQRRELARLNEDAARGAERRAELAAALRKIATLEFADLPVCRSIARAAIFGESADSGSEGDRG